MPQIIRKILARQTDVYKEIIYEIIDYGVSRILLEKDELVFLKTKKSGSILCLQKEKYNSIAQMLNTQSDDLTEIRFHSYFEGYIWLVEFQAHQQIGKSFLNKKLQGKGYGSLMYKLLIDQLPMQTVILSDDRQTPQSEKLWRNLATHPNLHLEAYDIQNNKFLNLVLKPDRFELDNNLSPYNDTIVFSLKKIKKKKLV